MRIAMFFKWDGVTLDQYEEVRNIVKWEENVPDGAVLHICSHDGNALRITDIWESAEDFNNFANDRLLPVTRQVGLTNEPQVEIYPLHALFAPAFEAVEA